MSPLTLQCGSCNPTKIRSFRHSGFGYEKSRTAVPVSAKNMSESPESKNPNFGVPESEATRYREFRNEVESSEHPSVKIVGKLIKFRFPSHNSEFGCEKSRMTQIGRSFDDISEIGTPNVGISGNESSKLRNWRSPNVGNIGDSGKRLKLNSECLRRKFVKIEFLLRENSCCRYAETQRFQNLIYRAPR